VCMVSLVLGFALRKLNWGRLRSVSNIYRKGMRKPSGFVHNVSNELGDK